MTIRHKVNITQKINDFEVVLSKYSSRTNENKQIGEIVPNSKRSQNMKTPIQVNKGVRNVNYKSESIKMIDEKINNILKKHENVNDFQRPPLGPRNNVAILVHKKQASLYEFDGKEPQDKHSPFYSTKRQTSQKANEAIKQQCKRLRERSNKIFQQNGDLTDRYQSLHQPQQLSKYDKQIKKLNERIKKAEQQKKKLNIEFSPFVASAKSKVRLDNFSMSSGKPSYTATPAKVEDVKIKGKESISEFKVQEIEVTTPVKVEKKCGIVKNRIVQPQQQTNNALPNVVAQIVEKQSEALLPPKKPKSKEQINQLISVLCKQIILDEQLRNQKIWFTFSNEESKWQTLEEKLNQIGESMPPNQIRSLFQSTVQQHNPFYRWGNVNFNDGITSLLTSYIACKEHWQTTISNKWSKQLFQQQSLKQLLLFQQCNDSFTIQGLVRFLNTETGNFYRNRDLHLIFKRLTSNPQIDFSEFISTISL